METPEPIACSRHPAEMTRLRCTECETSICPKCMVMYEAGFKCPACTKNRPSHAEQVSLLQYGLAGMLTLTAGWLYGWLHPWVMALGFIRPLGIPILAYFLAYGIGIAAGNLIQKILRYRLQRRLIILVAVASSLGLLLSPMQPRFLELFQILMTAATQGAGSSPLLYLLGRGLELLAAVIFIRGVMRPFRLP